MTDTADVTTDVEPAKDLPTLVAEFRASDPGSRELECLAVSSF